MVQFVKSFPSKVNIIEYNSIDDGKYQQADPIKVDAFADYLESTSTDTYFTETATTATTSVYNLETDAVANYEIGDQISFSVMYNDVQEIISYTVTRDDIGANNAATALAVATAITAELNPTSFTITQTADTSVLTLTGANGATIEAGATITKSTNSSRLRDLMMFHQLVIYKS
mgnify:CR=1 FL=1